MVRATEVGNATPVGYLLTLVGFKVSTVMKNYLSTSSDVNKATDHRPRPETSRTRPRTFRAAQG